MTRDLSAALKQLKDHVKAMSEKHRIIYECALGAACQDGTFMAPTAIAIDSMKDLPEELFGPKIRRLPEAMRALWQKLKRVEAQSLPRHVECHETSPCRPTNIF